MIDETPARLVCIYGLPAVGKLTVAEEVARLSGYLLFHNHLTVNALRSVFDFGSEPFSEVLHRLRLDVFETAIRSGINLIFTNNSAWSGPDPRARFVALARRAGQLVEEAGGEAMFVRLTAPLPVLEARVASGSRRDHGKLLDVKRLRQLVSQRRPVARASRRPLAGHEPAEAGGGGCSDPAATPMTTKMRRARLPKDKPALPPDLPAVTGQVLRRSIGTSGRADISCEAIHRLSTETGMLDVGDGNAIYWETCGNPEGLRGILLHGGPGSGCQLFDPQLYRIVLFDQSGCGRSRPRVDADTDLLTNTTGHLVIDLERLREHPGIDRWLVRGVSRGVTLGLV